VSGPPRTVHDYDPREVVSALQKCIRRGDVDAALYWAAELERSGLGWWLWKRLRVIVTEDVGPAWPEGPAVIEALWRTYSDLRRAGGKQPKRRPWRLVVMHAVYLLATAPKSRIADWASMVMFSETERREIPDVALGQHTSRGRRMGRRTEHFFEEGTRLVPHAAMPDEDVWRERARHAIEGGGPLPDEEPDDTPTLFD
jgi:replication-associated recombination protein RarA